jgi:hypothetical protein
MSVLAKPYFDDEEAAFRYLESVVWADGKSCPHCGAVNRLTAVKASPEMAYPRRPASLWSLQRPVHRQGWHSVRTNALAAAQGFAGCLSDDQQQEGYQCAPIAPRA